MDSRAQDSLNSLGRQLQCMLNPVFVPGDVKRARQSLNMHVCELPPQDDWCVLDRLAYNNVIESFEQLAVNLLNQRVDYGSVRVHLVVHETRLTKKLTRRRFSLRAVVEIIST